jgi:Spy/CpxP family protein refolding chaperone
MRSTLLVIRAPWRASSALCAAVVMFAGAGASFPQAPMAPMGRPAPTNSGSQNRQLADQIAEMRAEIARLQAAVDKTGVGDKSNANQPMPMGSGKGMGMMDGEMSGKMQGRKRMEGEMSGMSAMPPGGGMKAPAKAMGMCCMGMMGMPPSGNSGMSTPPPPPAMSGMSGPSSAMPGQPGESHLLHIGSTGFFLNHSQHIMLTGDQKTKLNRLKEKALVEQASAQRKIDQAEQELYSLTGADQVDTSRIQAKVAEIEKLRTEQRMDFIHAVMNATNVLSHDQHQALMGTMPAAK